MVVVVARHTLCSFASCVVLKSHAGCPGRTRSLARLILKDVGTEPYKFITLTLHYLLFEGGCHYQRTSQSSVAFLSS